MQVKVGSYTGNGTTQALTGVGFQPDAVILKRGTFAASTYGLCRTSSMDATESKPLAGANGMITDGITSLDADGFSVGAHAAANASSVVYYYIALKEHANDLEVGTYTGNGADDRNITSGGFQPEFVLVMGDTAQLAIGRYAANAAGGSQSLPSNDFALTDRIQAFNSDGFQVGTNAAVNGDTLVYHYIALKSTASFCKVSSYTGNATDNTSITGVGFQPNSVWTNEISGFQNVGAWHPSSLAGDATLSWSSSGSIADQIQAFEADGFQVGTHASVNESGSTIAYVAFIDGDSQAGGASKRRYTLTLTGVG